MPAAVPEPLIAFAAPLAAMLLQPAVTGSPAPAPWRAQAAYQVRVEQRTTIRIISRPGPMLPDPWFAEGRRIAPPRLRERRIGNCLPAGGIVGMGANADRQLIFYMRDQRVVSAMLERTCNVRDFYSGFYMARSADGKLCVNRDTLQARNGANCKVKAIREVIQDGE